jgi:hypothetical protein
MACKACVWYLPPRASLAKWSSTSGSAYAWHDGPQHGLRQGQVASLWCQSVGLQMADHMDAHNRELKEQLLQAAVIAVRLVGRDRMPGGL